MAARRAPGGPGGGRPGPARGTASRAAAPSSRSASRPANARRAAATGGATRTSAPEPRKLTGRATILALVLVGLLLAYAYPMRVYLSQQAEIAQLRAQQADQQADIDDLRERRAKWDDPEYVKAQARKRFQLVEQGDRTYIVIFDATGAARDAGIDPAARPDDTPWYGRLWSSIGAANSPPAP